MHVGIDLLVASLEGKKRLAAELVSLISVLIFAVLILIYGGGRLVHLTHELNQISGALGVRMSYVYSIIPISGVLMCIYAFHYIGNIIFKGEIHKPNEIDSTPAVTQLKQGH